MSAPVPPAADESGAGRLVWRFRLLTCCLVLGALAFIQEPGRIVSDTKLDLALAPGEFLGRAAHLWDPEGAFGQVQNQAYGYLFPMGPFFWVGDLAGMPPWVVQRLWWTLVMVVAFLGVVKLAELLGIGSPASRLVAGFAYALSPRMLTTLGPISVEAWPSALAPWVLVALVWGTTTGPPRRAAALAALGVGAVGGVNAAATAAVLPLGVIWLLTRAPGPRRRSMMLWWPAFTLLATAWWLVPLFLLGRYSPPFLDFIEPASVTTFPTTLFDTLRGTSNWVPYVEPAWQAGNDLLTEPLLILNGAVLLVLGVMGLARPDLPQRRFLVLGLLAGMVLVTAGHMGEVQGWFAAAQRDLLDGALAPLRNVHKFDALVRIPLVLGLAHAVTALTAPRLGSERATRPPSRAPVGVLVLASVATAGAAGPLLAERLAHDGSFAEVPAYWQQTADWLGERDDGTRALLVPGSSFGTYLWGDPRDEPMQVLAQTPWAVRNAIPLAPPGNIRMLDAVESVLISGRGSAGLADYLARAGVGWVVVRNDLQRDAGSPNPIRVRHAVASSPGLVFQAAFGPVIGGGARLDDARDEARVLVDGGWQARYPAVEVYRVSGARPAATGPVDALIAGGPEDLLTLAEQEVLPPTPTVLGPDRSAEAEPERILLTDGLRRRERNFGRVHDATSGVLTAGSESDRDVPARDYLLPGQEEWETVARWDGAREVSASSSLADVGSVGEARPELAPYSALDGDLSTQWVSGSEPRAAWLQVDLETPRNLSSVELVGSGVLGDDRQLVRVRTEQGVGEAVGLSPGEPALAQFPPGPTDWIRVEGAAGIAGQRLAVAEIDVPGVTVSRPLVTPVLPESWDAPDLISLDATAGWRSGCAPIRFDVRCVPDETRKGEEPLGLDRVVTMPRAGRYAARLQVRPRPGAELDEILQRDRLVRVRATSTATDEPSGSVSAAVDGLRGTTWIAAGDDDDPALTVSWVEPQRVDRLRLVLDRQAAATPAEEVTVTYDGGEQTAEVDEHGFVRLDPLRTRSMEIALSPGEPARGLGSDGRLSEYGVGVSELRIPEATGLPMIMPATPERRPCGSGPDLLVDGVTLPTRVNASRRDLILGDPVEATLCGAGRSVALVPGENRLTFGSDRGFTGVTVLLGEPAELAEAAAPSPAAPTAERLERDQVTPAVSDLKGEGLGRPGAAALGDNWNAGWAARDQGEPVDPLVVDGWRQGWQLPVQGEELTVEFAPDRWYRLGLLVGGAVAAVLTALVLVGVLRRRRTSLAPEGAEHPRTPIALLGSGVLAAGLLAGWPGLLMAVVLVLGVAVWSGLWARHRSWLVAAPVAAAALVVWWRPWGAAEGWAGELALPQLLVLCSVLMLAVGDSSRWLGRLRQGGLRSRSRMKGSSTAR